MNTEAYREWERQAQALAEAQRTVYLPNVAPAGPVENVLVCMEPSLGRWAKGSMELGRLLVAQGAVRNFVSSDLNVNLLQFCARHYLPGRTHLTDISKGAMLGKDADWEREKRYESWREILREELNLIAAPGARIIAVGADVWKELDEHGFSPRAKILHYSPLAASHRNHAVVGHEEAFARFLGSVRIEDVVAVAAETYRMANVPAEADLARLGRCKLTESHQKLIFHYKKVFEALRTEWECAA